jgi:gliding motility-associated-like protein
LPGIATSQVANNWVFGQYAGVDFGHSPPKTFTSSIYGGNLKAVDTLPANVASSISDCKGRLLFYTNGCKVWDSTHHLMANGNLKCGKPSQSDVYKARYTRIIPKPGNPKQYYLFYESNFLKNINYAVIDMSKNQGKGKVTQKRKKTNFPNGRGGKTIIKHQNNKDFWFVFNNNRLELQAYPITESGIGQPVTTTLSAKLSNSGDLFGIGFESTPNGQYLLSSGYLPEQNNPFVLQGYSGLRFKFDKKTGKFGKAKGLVPIDKINPNYQGNFEPFITGLEASPNNELIYITVAYTGNSRKKIKVFQIQNAPKKPFKTAKEIGKYENFWNLELAPNDKIYIGKRTSINVSNKFLGAIQNPNVRGKGCNVKDSFIDLSPSKAGNGLPSIYRPTPDINFKIQSPCPDTTQFFNLTDTTGWDSTRRNTFVWDFGDGTIDTTYQTQHYYDTPGTYEVKLTGLNQCQKEVTRKDSVTIYKDPVAAGFQTDTTVYQCRKAQPAYRDTSTNANQWHYRLQEPAFLADSAPRQDSGQRPTFLLDSTGTFTIRQVAANPNCSDTAYLQDSVYIEAAPEAQFTLTDTLGCPPYKVTLPDSSTYDSLETGFARWQLKPYSQPDTLYQAQVQGNTDTALTLTDTGYYQVRLQAHNNQGCVDTLTKDSAIYLTPKLAARAQTPVEAICPGDTVRFQDQSKNADTVTWLFGDGSTSGQANPRHAYQQTGYYDVTVAASNGICWDSTTYDSLVRVYPTPQPGFSLSYGRACTPLDVTITSKATGQVDSTHYAFGNGTTQTAADAQVTYQQEDSFRIRQTVTNTFGCQSQDSLQLTVYESPDADYTVADTQVFCHAKAFSFDNLSAPEQPQLKDSLLFQWAFGVPSDSVVTEKQADPVKQYSKEGDYPVQLVATNGLCKDSLKEFLKVRLRQKPVLDFSVSDTAYCTPATINLNNATQHADSFVWTLEGRSDQSTRTPSYTLQEPGTYDVQLRAFSKEGCADTLQKENFIAVKAEPKARFAYNPKIGCAPLTVNFQNQSKPTDQDQTYTWHLGNGETLTKASPTYTYPEPGRDTNQIKLIADNGFCADTQTQPVTITGFDGRSEAISLTNVTVRDNQHIRLTWQPHPDGQQYQVQRQKPNSFWRNVATTDTSTYLDQQVNVQTQHYRYRVKGLDSCGNASAPSNMGRNILLEGESKGNESATLQWNPYQEWPRGVSEYHLQKSGQPGNLERLTSTADTTYQDQDYFNLKRDSQYYRVEAIRRGQPDIISTSNISALPFEARLFIPDAFSPNGDGLNDTFQVNATGIFNYSLKVYNRWGELVYESNNPEAGWDGIYKGEQAPTGVYFYTLYATGNYGKPISREGPVQLIR